MLSKQAMWAAILASGTTAGAFLVAKNLGNDNAHCVDRSWHEGKVTLVPYRDQGKPAITVKGDWPGASDDLWIRYTLSLLQYGSKDKRMMGGEMSLQPLRFIGFSDYSHTVSQLAEPSQPHRFVFDYEIWKGKPGKGILLTKTSVFSDPITPEKN